MGKNSFTLFETLLSITLIIIVINGFSNLFLFKENSHDNYMKINSLENRFDTNDYSNLTKINKKIKITINDTDTEFIDITQYSFENENLKLVKYEN